MTSPASTEPNPEKPVADGPDFSDEPRSIAEWALREDFPQCALGAHVDIHGFTGVVVEIVGRSFKVVSKDGVKQRFNGDRLRTLFAPRERAKPKSVPRKTSPARKVPAVKASEAEEEPARVFVANPDFSVPVRAIQFFASQSDFPKCVYGQHVELPGYSGVVVEIVKDSLRIQSAGGSIRRFNGAALKKLYGES